MTGNLLVKSHPRLLHLHFSPCLTFVHQGPGIGVVCQSESMGVGALPADISTWLFTSGFCTCTSVKGEAEMLHLMRFPAEAAAACTPREVQLPLAQCQGCP